MMFIRNKIIYHLEWSNFEEASGDNEETVKTAAQKYGLSSERVKSLKKKVEEIKEEKEQYIMLKNKIDKILNILNKIHNNILNDMNLLIDILNETMKAEYTQYTESIMAYSKLNDYVSSSKIFTYNDEFSLLYMLDFSVREQEPQYCTCQACVLENVFLLGYILVNIKKLEPQIWEQEIIHGNWICEFEIRYRQKLQKFFKYSECKMKDKSLMSASQLSASPNKRKIVELDTPSTMGPQSNLQFNNICIHKKMKYKKILKVMSHQLSRYFQAAAKEVINKKGGIATVAQKYELNIQEYHEILGNRTDIIERKKNYLDLKNKIEEAVKITSLETLSENAQRFNIDESKLKEEFEKYLKNKNEYEYDEFTSSNKILTYKEESSLLTLIQKWTNYRLSCHCLICAMEFLCMQAYIIYTSREEFPREWNTQVEINWLCEFEVRYIEELSKYMPLDMIQFLAPIDSSDMTEETLETLQKYARKE